MNAHRRAEKHPLPEPESDESKSERSRRLAQMVEMLSKAPTVRTELVADIQKQVASGEYATEEKLDLAIYRMLRDILK